ncbi:hypothetical protein AHF37_08548 [Paragonimus kellicotti]|nr:hypothetical protein AHF37_08548 [Paragonimus kellicotti]
MLFQHLSRKPNRWMTSLRRFLATPLKPILLSIPNLRIRTHNITKVRISKPPLFSTRIKPGTGPSATNDVSPISPYSGSTSKCPTSVPSKNCLLPRYLADSIKRVTTDHNSNRYGCTKSEMFSKLYARSATGGSRDSGISVSSCSASPNSPSVGYEEYKKQHRPPTADDDNCTSARMFSTSGPMSLLDHMIKVQQERL